MIFNLVDKEENKSGKGFNLSLYGLNDGKHDAKILRELGELYKQNEVSAGVFDKKIKGLTTTSRDNAKALKANSANNIELSNGLLDAAESADKMTISTRLLTGATKAAKLALSIGINMAIFAGISAVVTLIVNQIGEAKRLSEEAAAAINDLDTNVQSLTDTKKSVVDLRTELDKGNLSQAEAYDKRKELISLQDELITKYGKEAEGIDFVTGSIKEQGDAIDELDFLQF